MSFNKNLGDPIDADANFAIHVKKDEAVGVIMTYISMDIDIHTSGIDYPHVIWTKLKTLFNKITEGEVLHIEKELISLEPLSFDQIEDYLARIKEL